MNSGDIGMTRDGDMFSGRTSGSALLRGVMRLALRLPAEDRFVPGIELAEDCDLAESGLAGVRALQLAGHSAGSIALLFEDGSLICGDLLENRSAPKLGSIMDDVRAARRGVEQAAGAETRHCVPGHGAPFDFSELGPIE